MIEDLSSENDLSQPMVHGAVWLLPFVREHAGQAFVEGCSCWAKATCGSEDQGGKRREMLCWNSFVHVLALAAIP